MQKMLALIAAPPVDSMRGIISSGQAIRESKMATILNGRLDRFSDKYTVSARYIYNGLTSNRILWMRLFPVSEASPAASRAKTVRSTLSRRFAPIW